MISLLMVVLFAFPVKAMCKLTIFSILENSGFNFSYIILGGTSCLLAIVSALVTYILYKVKQYINNKGEIMNLYEFMYIFILSFIISLFFILVGFVLGGSCILFDCLIAPLLAFVFSYIEDEYCLCINGNKDIMNYFMLEDKSYCSNENSNTETSFSNSSSSSTDSQNLMKSLNQIEDNMEYLDKNITRLRSLIEVDTVLHRRLNICSKVLIYLPVKGIALSQVFVEASSTCKTNVISNKLELDENSNKFLQLRVKRLEVLDKLEEIQ